MNSISKKGIYLEFGGPSGSPIFFRPWWLDVVCQEDKWDVCLSLNNSGEIAGAMPCYISTYFWLKIIRTPPFTPYLGVWLDYSQCSERNVSRYGFENEVIGDLVEQLPKVVSYHQIHPPQLQNWLPFYWRGYRQTTRYTYVIENTTPDFVLKNMRDDVRNKIRKAECSGLHITEQNDLEKLILLLGKTFKRQNLEMEYRGPIFQQLHDAIQNRGQGKIFFAQTETGQAHAALYLIWDEKTAYCWQLGSDEKFTKSGAVQLLIWYGIQAALNMGKSFNFEGSMLPHIEPVFRAFGAERRPVFQIRKFGNRFLEALWVLLKG